MTAAASSSAAQAAQEWTEVVFLLCPRDTPYDFQAFSLLQEHLPPSSLPWLYHRILYPTPDLRCAKVPTLPGGKHWLASVYLMYINIHPSPRGPPGRRQQQVWLPCCPLSDRLSGDGVSPWGRLGGALNTLATVRTFVLSGLGGVPSAILRPVW